MDDLSQSSKEKEEEFSAYLVLAKPLPNIDPTELTWRKNKVKDLITRGYKEYEVAGTLLRVSQSTVSRDIYYIQKELLKKKTENYGERLFEVYRNSLLGLDEVVKKLWTIIDSSKIDEKEKMKAINLIMQCYKQRFLK